MNQTETEKTLRDAIESGEILTIRYHGGSQPGASREIAPIQITKDKVRARCYASNAVKLFAIGKIEIIETLLGNQNEWDPAKQAQEFYKDLRDAYEKTKLKVEAMGYYAELKGDKYSLRYLKDDRPKEIVAIIAFSEYSNNVFLVLSAWWKHAKGSKSRGEKRSKPYTVWVLGQSGKSFKSLDKAMNDFLKRAKAYAQQD